MSLLNSDDLFATVANMFQALGWTVIDQRGKYMHDATQELRLPVLDIFRTGARYWINVRSKQAWAETARQDFSDFDEIELLSGASVICVSVDADDGAVDAWPARAMTSYARIGRIDPQGRLSQVDRLAVENVLAARPQPVRRYR